MDKKNHAGRKDLAGEHKAGDAGQLILAILFLLVWLADSFFFELTTFLNEIVPGTVRLVAGIMVMIIAGYISMTGLKIVFGEVRDKPQVIRKGVFGIIRHPVYFGEILLYFGLLLFSISLAAAFIWIIVIVFLYHISRYEEKILLDFFGEEYRIYMKEVPMWIPGLSSIFRKKYRNYCITLIILTLTCCKSETPGPFFGNGFRNGWADQTSVVIWTRLTKEPEMNREGPAFKIPSAEEHRRLDRQADIDSIFLAQIPQGYTLDQMEGACPGMSGEVRLLIYPLREPDNRIETDWTPVDATRNFTCQWKLENLTSGTKYVVEISARKNKKSGFTSTVSGSFRTPPDAGSEDKINFCIVTCHDYPRRDDPINGHKIYKSMLQPFPDFLVHTGDIEYYDKPGPFALSEELIRFKWDRIFALPNQRDFYKQVTTYFMKDDHDVLRDDAYPGMTYGTVTWERGLEIFDREQFPSNDLPYKTIRWGKDLQIWLMEGRNFRSKNSDPDGPGKTIWGTRQKEWLFETLKESDAAFKLLITPAPILGPDRDNKRDNYSNSEFSYEGNEIREFLKQFDNVYICNGDRHWQYVTNIPGTNLWEFSCGAGSDTHAGGWTQGDVRLEHRFLRVKGGYLRGSVYRNDGKVYLRFQHCDVDGKVVHEESFIKQTQNI